MKRCSKYEELIERYLTGEILTEEKDALEQHIAVCSGCRELYSDISEIDELLRHVPDKELEPSPYLKTRIMARVRDEEPEKVRVFALRPLHVIAAALCLVLIAGVYALLSRPKVVRVVQLPEVERKRPADIFAPQFTDVYGNSVIREVKIFFYYPEARNVAVTGDFNNWDSEGLPMAPTGKKGLWEISLRFRPGVYSYNFIIDGKMIVPDPNAPNQAPDGFGGMNSLLFVGKGDTI